MGVYDGQKIDIGRVVVDSTWHHWFDVNLLGFEADATSNNYQRIQTFYRNIGVWLATAYQRTRMLSVLNWFSMFTVQGIQEYGREISIWSLGATAKDVLGRSSSKCLVREWIIDLFPIEFYREFFIPERIPVPPEPCLSCPPFELIEEAMLGAIIKELLPQFEKMEQKRISNPDKKLKLNEKEIMMCIDRGVQLGYKELRSFLVKSNKQGERLNKLLDKFKPNANCSKHHKETELA